MTNWPSKRGSGSGKSWEAAKVTVLSVGPDRATAAIRTALAMGADEGVLISDPALGKPDPLTTAKVLAAALKAVPFDLIHRRAARRG